MENEGVMLDPVPAPENKTSLVTFGISENTKYILPLYARLASGANRIPIEQFAPTEIALPQVELLWVQTPVRELS